MVSPSCVESIHAAESVMIPEQQPFEPDWVEMSDDDLIKKDIEEKKWFQQEEVVVDILECSSSDDEIEVSECCNDDVCSNSSFSGTVSQHYDDETQQTASNNDQEADSFIMCTASSLPLLVRKKQLTDHWRRFIHPITWRCKWLELKIKELQSQAGKYDKELQESNQTKQLELENLKSEEELGGVKALTPLVPCHAMKTRLKKRRKRKRVEEASDVSSYALNHNLFSYHENRKSFGDVALNDNSRNLLDKKNKNAKEEAVFCEEEETSPFEFREVDAFLEQILFKIEAVKLQACNLKNRVEKVVNENPSRFSLVNTLNNMLGSEQQKPLFFSKNEDDSEEKPLKSASVSSHHDTKPEDILLSEMMASSRQRKGKAIVPNKKTEQTSVGEGPSRPVRIRKPRNLDLVELKEETKRKRRRVTKEKRPNRQRKRGKRRSGVSTGSRRKS